MKIGIVTFWQSQDNYGQLLQCYALQQALIKLGHEPFLIRDKSYIKGLNKQYIYICVKIIFSRKIKLLSINYIKNKIKLYKKQKLININRCFDEFREKYIINTNRVYTILDLKITPPNADCYVCGSDQIWNCYSELYFLDWVERAIPKFAYSPSFGAKDITDDFLKKITASLKQFKAVTVREKSGIEICKKAGREDVMQVPDPTLLLRKQDYEKLLSTTKKHYKKNYILVYLLGWKTDINFNEIENFAKQRELDIIYVPSISNNEIECYNKEWNKTYPSIEEWISLISNAKYVITNSFHGTVFSIIFNRQIGISLIKGKWFHMNDRLYSLLRDFDLNDRVISNNLQILDNIIDYKNINYLLEREREKINNLFRIWFN